MLNHRHLTLHVPIFLNNKALCTLPTCKNVGFFLGMDISFYNKKNIHVYISSSACGLTNWPWVVLVRLVLGQGVTQFSEPHTDDAGGDKHDGGHQRVEENERHHPHLGPVMQYTRRVQDIVPYGTTHSYIKISLVKHGLFC